MYFEMQWLRYRIGLSYSLPLSDIVRFSSILNLHCKTSLKIEIIANLYGGGTIVVLYHLYRQVVIQLTFPLTRVSKFICSNPCGEVLRYSIPFHLRDAVSPTKRPIYSNSTTRRRQIYMNSIPTLPQTTKASQSVPSMEMPMSITITVIH